MDNMEMEQEEETEPDIKEEVLKEEEGDDDDDGEWLLQNQPIQELIYPGEVSEDEIKVPVGTMEEENNKLILMPTTTVTVNAVRSKPRKPVTKTRPVTIIPKKIVSSRKGIGGRPRKEKTKKFLRTKGVLLSNLRRRLVDAGEDPPPYKEMWRNYDKFITLQPKCKRLLLERSAENEVHCLICYDKVEENEKSGEELQKNLNAVFILRKLLEVPSEQLEKYLKSCKSPSNWVAICERCQPLIDNAFELNDKIVELMKQLEKCKQLVVDRITETGNGNESNEAAECPNRLKCKGHHSYLTDEIRKHVAKRSYISSPSLFKEGDIQAKAKYEAYLEAIQVRKRQLTRKPKLISMTEQDCCISEESHNPTQYQYSPEDPESDLSQEFVEAVQPVPCVQLKERKIVKEKEVSYSCPHCPNLSPFPNVFSYAGHIIFHFDYPMQCSQCRVYLPSDSTKLENHWKRFHSEIQLTDAESRFHQVKFQPVDEPHQCYQCWQTLYAPSERDFHMKTEHQWLPDKKFDCVTCEERFMSLIELMLHRAKEHAEIHKFSCPVCPQQLKAGNGVDEASLKNHIASVHSSMDIPLVKPCPLCGQMFFDSATWHEELDSHILNTHSRFLKTVFPCNKCKRTFTTAFARQLHTCPGGTVECKPEAKMYSCSACPNLLQKMNHEQFQSHLAFHFERPFRCFLCKQYFSEEKAKQVQHWKEWHKNVPVEQSHFEKVEVERANLHPKSFKCPVCSMSFKNVTSDGKEFLDEPALYKHMDIHHTSLLSTYKLKACNYCGLVFTGTVDYFPNFITHKRKCHGFGSSVTCHICDDDFVTSALLHTHLSTAHQQTSLLTCDFCPFEAENCDYEGMHQHKLVRHGIAKKHAEIPVPPIKSSAKAAPNLLRKTNAASNIQYPASKNPIVARETEKILKPCQNKKHEATEEEIRAQYSCPMCPELAPMSVFAFFQHIAFHQQRPNKCTECQIYLPSSDDAINTHWNESHTDSPTTPRTTVISLKLGDVWEAWECRFCDQKFSSDDERELHEAKLHRKGVISKTVYLCASCPKSFCSMRNWQFHRVLAHPTDFELSCFYCNERFPIMTIEGVEILDSNARKQHVLKEHSNLPSIPQFDVCRYCGQCFSGFIALSSHLLEEHKVDEDNLFQCSMCSSSFKHPEEFHAHVKNHQQDPVPVQICDVCGWTCNNSSRKRGRESEFRFHQHRFRQHGILPPDKFPVLKCDVEGCPFQTVNPERFKNHKGVHLPQSERPYQCKECAKGFSDGSKLNVHMNIHKNANSKPFQCELCGNSFAVRNYLYIHMRLSHEGRFFPSTHKKKKPRKKKPKTTQSSTELSSEAECMDVNLVGNNSSENQETVPNSTSVISESVSISVQLDS